MPGREWAPNERRGLRAGAWVDGWVWHPPGHTEVGTAGPSRKGSRVVRKEPPPARSLRRIPAAPEAAAGWGDKRRRAGHVPDADCVSEHTAIERRSQALKDHRGRLGRRLPGPPDHSPRRPSGVLRRNRCRGHRVRSPRSARSRRRRGCVSRGCGLPQDTTRYPAAQRGWIGQPGQPRLLRPGRGQCGAEPPRLRRDGSRPQPGRATAGDQPHLRPGRRPVREQRPHI